MQGQMKLGKIAEGQGPLLPDNENEAKKWVLSRKKKKVATEKNSAAGNIETKVVKTEQNPIKGLK